MVTGMSETDLFALGMRDSAIVMVCIVIAAIAFDLWDARNLGGRRRCPDWPHPPSWGKQSANRQDQEKRIDAQWILPMPEHIARFG